jgi:hypothetical protein
VGGKHDVCVFWGGGGLEGKGLDVVGPSVPHKANRKSGTVGYIGSRQVWSGQPSWILWLLCTQVDRAAQQCDAM